MPKKKNRIVIFILQSLIQLYRYTFSIVLSDKCRYIPTCSVYGLEALKKHGPWKGTALTVKRILRCHPYSKHSWHDPVP
ncbi:MAG: membrane protein insertion efficiency factor YidD [Alphaproteobacteria bacterium]